ncbi:MAG TPA: GTP-binding protein [Candidatus Methylacidiphilales bacterium]|nr:GTP-binding protein [Candidatus Methylacidiphilales bacterium]
MRTQPLPLILLAGFLGSGKTSTLRHWLAHTTTPLKRTAVVINDFGAMNVDAALLARRQIELRSITGGCVCCQSFEDLVEQVLALAENPDIDLVWIETSGLADPEEVLDHLSAPALQKSTVVRRLILVIDGSDFPCSWRGRAVQEEQVRYADLILLNKTDRIDEPARQRVEIALRSFNPSARIVMTQHGQIDPELLSAPDANHAHPDISPNKNLHRHEHHPHETCHHEHESDSAADHHHGHAAHAASTFFLPLHAPVPRTSFARFLDALPASVFRAKGFVRFADDPEKIHTFQQVRDQAELLVLPLENGENLTTGLVFIGPQLDENQIRVLAGELPGTSHDSVS